MPDASLRVETRTTGADLRAVARELRQMNDRKVKDLLKRKLEDAARPFVPRVRASVMAIPTTGEKHTGLRARIADCAQVASWEPKPRQVSVAVEMDPKRMPMGELALPLRMEGVASRTAHRTDARWRHPVYGTPEAEAAVRGHGRGWVWVTQPPHPYFYQAAAGYGRAAGDAVKAALEDITRQING
jgi:hypothetical protein